MFQFSPVTACALLLSFSAHAQVTSPQPAPAVTPEQAVDTIKKVFGEHQARAIHAKGAMLEGTFAPAPSAAGVSMAPHLQQAAVPVLVRFSNFAGVPDIPDNHPLAAPRGLAIRFMLPDGGKTDIVAHSFNGFSSATPDDFHELLQALAASGPGAVKPTRLDTYLAGHPAARTFLTAPKPAPASFASLPYYGVNAFRFTNAAGKVSYGRYRIEPAAVAYLTEQQAATQPPGYLKEELAARLARGPVVLKLVLQIAADADKVDDPSTPWPDSRATVELGTLTLTAMVDEGDEARQRTVFVPNGLPAGIAVEDRMVDFRAGSYAISFQRRQ